MRSREAQPNTSGTLPFNESATIDEIVRRVPAIGWRDGVVALWVLLRYRFSE